MEENDNLLDIRIFLGDLKLKKVYQSLDVALRTVDLLEKLVSNYPWRNAKELMNLIIQKIKFIKEQQPCETIVSNIMTHFLKVIRDDFRTLSKKKREDSSLYDSNILDYSEYLNTLQEALINSIAEYRLEIQNSSDNIATHAIEYTEEDEVIMTYGISSTVEHFLKTAAEKRKIKVYIAEAAPYYYGHTMAANLDTSNIDVTVIPDTAVFTAMARVNKVIISTYAILANGCLQAPSGAYTIALAAKHFSVEVVVLCHTFKLSTIYSGSIDEEAFNIMGNSGDVITSSPGDILDEVEILNPLYDSVPEDLISIFISHQGGFAPSYIYRVLGEMYHPDDYHL